jgi:hypothetical protein
MKKIKDIIKKNPEPSKPTNSDPGQLGQYSAKYQIAESASLNQYLQSKGIDPQYVSRDTKIAHSKSAAYLTWQKAHMRREDVTIKRDDGDARSLDAHSPTMRRQKRLSQVGKHYTIKPVTSHTPQVPIKKEGSQTPQLTPEAVGDKQDATVKAWNNRYLIRNLLKYLGLTEEKKAKPSALERYRAAAVEREKKHKETEKNSGGMTPAIDRLQKHMNKEETELEKKASKYDFSKTKSGKPVPKQTKPFRMGNEPIGKMKEEISQAKVNKFHAKLDTLVHKSFGKRKDEDVSPLLHSIHKKADAERNKDLDKFIKGHKQSKLIPTKEGVGDPLAATQSPADGANGGNELSEKKRQMSKSARMIKSLYKKNGMVKEDMYDHEKEDKSVVTYGKKPKHEKADDKDSKGENKPHAAAVLTGGTTLTGEKRDDIEIDPMMRNRPGQPDVTKKDDKDKKKDGKKEDSKKDK